MLQLLHVFLFVLYVALFGLLIMKWRFFDIEHVNKKHLVFFFLLKVTAGLALTFVFTYYYTDQSKADIYRYFNDSKIISSLLFSDPVTWIKMMSGWSYFDSAANSPIGQTMYYSHPAADFITSNSFLIRFISVLNYFSAYNIYVDTVLLNCITFIAITGLFKVVKPYFDAFPQILYWPFYLMPSFLFWSSGLLKEGLIFVGIAGYLWVWLSAQRVKWWQSVVPGILFIAIIGSTKIYVAGVMLVCTGLLPVANTVKQVRLARLAFYALVLAGVIYAFMTLPVCERIIEKRNEFVLLSLTEHSGSGVDNTLLNADCSHLLRLVPAAFVNAVIRPFVWGGGNMFQLLFALENTAFLSAIVALLLFCFKKPEGQKLWLALFCLVFALLNYMGIGLTVPIMGAVVHYRIVALPFLLLAVLCVTDLEKVKIFLPQRH